MEKVKIPEGWTLKPMPEIIKWGSGGTPKATEKTYYGGSIPWVIIGDLNDGLVSYTEKKITELGLENSSAKMIPSGTLLLAMYGSIGKLGITTMECCTNQAIASAVRVEGVTVKYMFYYLLAQRQSLLGMGKGGTQKNISLTVINSLYVPVPSLPTQEKIVLKIEELFSELDKGIEELTTAKARLKVYRQAVLDESFKLATDAEISTVNSVCNLIIDCKHSTPKWTDEGYLCLRTTNFRRGFLDLSEKNYVSEETFEERILRGKPQSKDILYSREGAILGIACMVPEDTELCLGQRMMLMRTSEKCLPLYLMHYLNSPAITSIVIESTGGSASPHINIRDIKKFEIPLPLIEIQEQIVLEIESRLSICDQIEATIEESLKKAESLRQSILKEAFEGRLV